MSPLDRHPGRRRPAWRRALVAALVVSAASSAGVRAAWTSVDAGRGAVWVRYPAGQSPAQPAPLVVLLHGYGASGIGEELYLQLGSWMEAAGFIYTLPDGTANLLGERFWNATDACCDFAGSGVDDSAYLMDLVDAVDSALGVDRHRLFFVGHSNGGFMAYRMACDHADRIAAAVSLAGATFEDPLDCAPARPVRVLQIHGTADEATLYDGGTYAPGFPSYPGALATAATWAAYDGCLNVAATAAPFDADGSVAGNETTPLRYDLACHGGGAELWTIDGGDHLPALTDTFRARLRDWLTAAGDAIFGDAFESGALDAW